MPYETFDIDLREGKARETAFLRMISEQEGPLVEHKCDKKCKETGNLALEYQQRMPDGRIDNSGFLTSDAHWYAFEYFYHCWLFVPISCVRFLSGRAIKLGRSRWIGDDNNHRNALVPIEWFLKPYARTYRVNDESDCI